MANIKQISLGSSTYELLAKYIQDNSGNAKTWQDILDLMEQAFQVVVSKDAATTPKGVTWGSVTGTLEASAADPNTIYLVPVDDSLSGAYAEYIAVAKTSWEKIGTTAVDLSEYAKKGNYTASTVADHTHTFSGSVNVPTVTPTDKKLSIASSAFATGIKTTANAITGFGAHTTDNALGADAEFGLTGDLGTSKLVMGSVIPAKANGTVVPAVANGSATNTVFGTDATASFAKAGTAVNVAKAGTAVDVAKAKATQTSVASATGAETTAMVASYNNGVLEFAVGGVTLVEAKITEAVANGTVVPAVANGTITPYTFDDVTVPTVTSNASVEVAKAGSAVAVATVDTAVDVVTGIGASGTGATVATGIGTLGVEATAKDQVAAITALGTPTTAAAATELNTSNAVTGLTVGTTGTISFVESVATGTSSQTISGDTGAAGGHDHTVTL